MKARTKLLVTPLILTTFLFSSACYSAEKIGNVQFTSGNATGSWIKIAAAIADLTNKAFEGFPITAVPGGSVMNPSILGQGDAQIGMTQGPFLANARDGKPPYSAPVKGLTSIASLTPTALYFIVDAKIEADEISQMISAKIPFVMGAMPPGSSSSYLTTDVFKLAGLNKFSDIESYGGKVFLANDSSLKGAWSDRHIDMYIYNTSLPSAGVTEIMNVRKSKLLNIDEAIIDTLVKDKGFVRMTVPANTYPGQDKDIQTIGLMTILIAREDVPESVVYNITKAIFENKPYFEGVHSSFKAFDVKGMMNDTVVPLHKGALKYYKEKGLIK